MVTALGSCVKWPLTKRIICTRLLATQEGASSEELQFAQIFLYFPQQESREAAMMGVAVAGLSPQLLSSSSSSSSTRLLTSRRILFNLQSQSPSCAAACKVHATSSFPFTAPASGVSTLSHLNSIAWVWDSMVSLSSVCHYQDLLMGLPHIT